MVPLVRVPMNVGAFLLKKGVDMKQHVGVAIMIERDGKWVFGRETKVEVAGKWCFPVGHTELGETAAEAAVREAREEAGFEVELKKVVGVLNIEDGENLRSVVVYVGEIVGEAERDAEEISEIGWFGYEEIMRMGGELRFPQGTFAIMERLRSGKVYDFEMLMEVKEKL